MKFPRGFLKGFVVGLVGALLLLVGYFVFVYVMLFFEYGIEPEPYGTVEATVQNVFQQDIANDWGAIEQIIDPESDYELQDFSLGYTDTGEIRELSWMVQERQEDGSCELYAISRMDSEYTITQRGSGDDPCSPESYMPLDQFWNAMTSDFIRETAPQAPYYLVRLNVYSVLRTIESSSDQEIFAWDGSQLQGPIHSGQGYTVEQYMFKSESEPLSGQKMFLIGGTYQ